MGYYSTRTLVVENYAGKIISNDEVFSFLSTAEVPEFSYDLSYIQAAFLQELKWYDQDSDMKFISEMPIFKD